MIRRALQSEVKCYFDAQVAGGRDHVLEIGDRSEIGMNRVMATLSGTDRPWTADIVWLGGHRIVLAFAVRQTDGMHGRYVQHVESHRRDHRELSLDIAQCAVLAGRRAK